jgi:RNA polymerase sigma-70 factor (ECF subfamily)
MATALPFDLFCTAIPVPSETTMAVERAADDVELVTRVTTGDPEAFATLYRRYERAIFGFLYRLSGNRALAEDLLQETFTRVWVAAGTFSGERGAFRPWLYRIALNVTRSELGRKRHSMPHVPLDDERSLPDPTNHGDRTAERIDEAGRARAVARAIAGLPPWGREVVLLRCYEQLSFGEISQITGAPEGTLKARFHRSVAALRVTLGARGMQR